MGMQPLSARSIRRIARTTGLDVIHGAANGGYWHAFVTSAHEHGAWHRHTHEWEWTNAACTTSCKQLFPDTPPVRHGEAVTDTPACVCDHDGLPADYHLDGCPASGRPLPTPGQAAVIDALAQKMAAAVERARAAYDGGDA